MMCWYKFPRSTLILRLCDQVSTEISGDYSMIGIKTALWTVLTSADSDGPSPCCQQTWSEDSLTVFGNVMLWNLFYSVEIERRELAALRP
jgi:hypothetical protein